MASYLRAYCERAEDGKDGEAIRFKASTEGIKRDGKELKAENWKLENYQRNPVVLWVHDYMGRNLPIGRAEVAVEKVSLIADVVFDQQDEFARQVESKYRRGFLNAVSVGWNDVNEEKVVRHELLDISAVPVPGDPDALMERQYRVLKEMFEGDTSTSLSASPDPSPQPSPLQGRGGERRAIPPHTTEKAEEGAAWDGPGEVAKAGGKSQLRRMHAWVDEGMDEETKQAYKLPHHMAESGQVVWRGVAAAMARLLQAGTQIPDDDRRGVYNHLARHYAQFDKEAPEFRTAGELEHLEAEEIRGLFLEGEEEYLSPDPSTSSGQAPFPEGKGRAGAMLSGRNKADLERAVELIRGVLERASKAKPEDGAEEEEDERAGVEEQEVQAFLHNINLKLRGEK